MLRIDATPGTTVKGATIDGIRPGTRAHSRAEGRAFSLTAISAATISAYDQVIAFPVCPAISATTFPLFKTSEAGSSFSMTVITGVAATNSGRVSVICGTADSGTAIRGTTGFPRLL